MPCCFLQARTFLKDKPACGSEMSFPRLILKRQSLKVLWVIEYSDLNTNICPHHSQALKQGGAETVFNYKTLHVHVGSFLVAPVWSGQCAGTVVVHKRNVALETWSQASENS